MSLLVAVVLLILIKLKEGLTEAKKLANVLLVSGIEDTELSEITLLLLSLLCQDVTLVSMLSLNLS